MNLLTRILISNLKADEGVESVVENIQGVGMQNKIVQLMLSRFHINSQDGAIVERKDCKQVADEIISLFADEGYETELKNPFEKGWKRGFEVGEYVSSDKMTGQEWYERFITELEKDGEIVIMGVGIAKEAAKKASGIES